MKNPFHSRLWILCLALTGVAALPTTNLAQGTNCFPAPTGLVGMWRGDGNTLDSGGTNNGTTPYGMAYAPGIVGQAFDFDSSSRRVSIPDQTAFRLTNSLTIEGWIFPRQYNSGFIFFRGDNRGGYDAWTVDMYQAGFLNFQIDDATNNYASLLAPIATNQWQHIAATLDGATGDMKIYINGVLISQTNTAVRPIGNLDPAYDPAVGIGNHGGSFHQFPFNGLIDEISLYSRALSQSEIQAIYSAGERGKCAPVAPSPSCVAAPAGLVSWWKAESNALDAMGSNDGTLVGGSAIVSGKVGGAFSFDGIDDYVKIPRSPSLNVSNQLTIEFWMKADPTNAMNTYQGLVTSDFYGIEIANGYALGPLGVEFFISTDGGASVSPSSYPDTATVNGGGAVVSAGEWHHVAGTYDGAKLQLYIDGQPWGNPAYHSGSISPMLANSFVAVGSEAGRTVCPQCTGSRYFNGLIDEPTVYNRALSASEVRAIYNAGSAGKCPTVQPPPSCADAPAGLVAWWRAENNALDAMGHNDGAMPNGELFVPGEVGYSFHFNGSNQCVQIPHSPGLISSNFSVEAWVKPMSPVDDPIGQEVIFGQSYGAAQLLARPGTTGVRVAWQFGTDHYNFYWTEATNELPIGQYSHLAGTWDGTTLRLYINGVLASESKPGTAPVDSGCDFSIGGFYLPEAGNCQYIGQFFNGDIDEVSLYQRVLSAGEIQGIYAASGAGKCPVVQPPPSCVDAPAGLIGWWKAENGMMDSVGGNDGVSVGGVICGTGKVGFDFNLNGNGYVRVPGSDLWSFGTNDFSIELWADFADLPANSIDYPGGGLLVGCDEGAGWQNKWFFAYAGGVLSFHINDPINGPAWIAQTPFSPMTNQWYHLGITRSGSLFTIYTNGVVAGSAISTRFVPNASAPLTIGEAEGFYFDGELDEISIYNKALSSAEISAIYNADYVGKCRVPLAPRISTQPVDRTAFVGDSTTFNVMASGDGPLGYQWLFNGAALPGKTIATLTLANLQLTNSGNYSVVITNPIGSITSAVAVLTVKLPPPCTPPLSGLIGLWKFENNVIDNWDSNDGTTPYGTGYSPGKVGMAFNATGGRYVRIVDSQSLRLTNGLTLTAWVNPSIQSGSTPRTILAKYNYPFPTSSGTQSSFYLGTTNNGLLYFAVSASGSVRTNTQVIGLQPLPLNRWTFVTAVYDGNTLQLYTNGVLAAARNYSGGIFAGTSDLGIGGIALGSSVPGLPFSGLIDEVAIYDRALMPDEIKAINDSDFTGMCLVGPSIISNPLSQAVPLGEDVKFTVSVAGSRPLRYQWQFNGMPIYRATNSMLILEKLKDASAGFYSVFVSNAVGTTLSASAQLKLLPAPSCVTPPDGLISWWPLDGSGTDVMGTNNLQFTVLTSPAYPTGKVDRAFNFPGYSSSLSGGRVVAPKSLDFGSSAGFSFEAWIKTYPTNPLVQSIVSQNIPLIEKRNYSPVGFLPAIGYSLSLYNGRLALWLAGTPAITTNAAIFVASGPDLRDGIFHHVAATVDRTSTNGGNLYVDGQPVLTFDPTVVRGSLSNSGGLYVGGTSAGSSNFFGLMDEVAIYGRALSPAEVQSIALAGAAGKCKVPPSILVQPTNQTVTVGSNAMFSVLATGQMPLRYQWLKSGAAPVFGATNATFNLSNVQAFAAGTYSVRITNAFGSVISSNVVLVVNPRPLGRQLLLREAQTGAMTVQFQGVAGQIYQVQVSTNLVDWTTIGIATDLGNGNFGFTDPDQNARPAGFYRIVQP